MRERLDETGIGIRVGRNVSVTGVGDGCLEERRVVALSRAIAETHAVVVCSLDCITTTEVWFDIDQSGLAEALNATITAWAESLHQQREIAIIRVHQARRVEIRDVLLVLAATPAGAVTLQNFVVRKHRDIPELRRFVCVVESERAIAVPGLPTGPGVYTANQVLHPIVPRDAGLRHPRVALSDGDAKGEMRGQLAWNGSRSWSAHWDHQRERHY